MTAEEARDDGIRLRPAATFWGHVQRGEGCWAWNGPIAPNGYGVTRPPRDAGHARSSQGRRVLVSFTKDGRRVPCSEVFSHPEANIHVLALVIE